MQQQAALQPAVPTPSGEKAALVERLTREWGFTPGWAGALSALDLVGPTIVGGLLDDLKRLAEAGRWAAATELRLRLLEHLAQANKSLLHLLASRQGRGRLDALLSSGGVSLEAVATLRVTFTVEEGRALLKQLEGDHGDPGV